MNLPTAFQEQMKALLPSGEYESFINAIQSEPITSIRLNPHKIQQFSHQHESIGWCTHGYYLNSRPTFTGDPLFHAGSYYVQEASSMFIHTVIRQLIGDQDVVALDLCAAPGGKSTLLRSALSEGSILLSNEYIRNRARILAENLIKWGHERTVVISNSPHEIGMLPTSFDLILADVPCSGEGMFRKDETAINEWSPTNVENCKERQREIIGQIWDTLHTGGLLIYSTCTYNTQENEENVNWICKELGGSLVSIELNPTWQIRGSLIPDIGPVYRFMPHLTRGEGLFLAVIRKESISASPTPERRKKEKGGKKQQTPLIPNEIKHWLTNRDMTYRINGSSILAIPSDCMPYYELWSQKLYLLKPFLTIAEQKGRDWIPTHELAVSRLYNSDAFPSVELSPEMALAYLRKEAINLPNETPKGMVAVTFNRVPLGFVKHLGTRSNNLYPQEWRIRNASIQYNKIL